MLVGVYYVLVKVFVHACHGHYPALGGFGDFHIPVYFGQHRLALGNARLEEFLHTRQAACDVRTRDAARVERPHRELSARLPDALRGDYAHCLAYHYRVPGGERQPVAHAAQPALRLASQRRPHFHARDARLGDVRQQLRRQQIIPVRQHLARIGIRHQLGGVAALCPVLKRRQQRIPLPVLDPKPLRRAAVLLKDDEFLRHVDQPPREIAAVGGSQRGVGQPLARAVRGYEVLQHAQPLAETRLDGAVNDAPLRVRHQPAHPSHLLDLRDVALCARRRHHIQPYAGVAHLLVFERRPAELAQVALNRARQVVIRRRPYVNRLLVAVVLCQQPVVEHLVQRVNVRLGIPQYLRLSARNLDVVDGYGNARLGGVVKAHILDIVQDNRRRLAAQQLMRLGCDVFQRALVYDFVDKAQLVRQRVVEDDAPRRGLHPLIRVVRAACAIRAVCALRRALPVHAGRRVRPPHYHRRAQVYLAVVVGDARVFYARETPPAAFRRLKRLRHVETAQHHIQRGRHYRLARTRRQHIVGAQHHPLCLPHRLLGQRHMHRHLVAVEVRVERRGHQRMQPYRAALYQNRLECLYAEPVQRGRAVEQHGPIPHHIL